MPNNIAMECTSVGHCKVKLSMGVILESKVHWWTDAQCRTLQWMHNSHSDIDIHWYIAYSDLHCSVGSTT